MCRSSRPLSILYPVLLAAALASACDFDNNRNSTTVSTSQTRADIDVTATRSEEVRVRVSLRESDGSFFPDPIKLKKGEFFEAVFDGETRRLKPDGDSDRGPVYATRFRGAPAEGPVQVIFRRESGEVVDEPLVDLRPEFEMLEPVLGERFDFDDVVPIRWSPPAPGEEMAILLRLTCRTVEGPRQRRVMFLRVEDDGEELYDLSQSPELDDPDIDPNRDCRLDIELEREDASGIAPPFAFGSSIESSQMRGLDEIRVKF